jgi:hypothetical protein
LNVIFLSKLTFEKETQKGVSLIWKISKEKEEKNVILNVSLSLSPSSSINEHITRNVL